LQQKVRRAQKRGEENCSATKRTVEAEMRAASAHISQFYQSAEDLHGNAVTGLARKIAKPDEVRGEIVPSGKTKHSKLLY